MAYLSLHAVEASYGKVPVLKGIDLTIDKGEVICLVGPSGSGKSTLLRVLVGLNKPRSGTVRFMDEVIDYGDKRALRAIRDRLAIVFQQYNLFQNMTVLKNVTIAPTRIKGRAAAEVRRLAMDLLNKVGIGDKIQSYPDELSGGQQQRVAIARALALQPEILLLDEVTSALDPELVNEVLDTIRLLVREGMTMVIVSHEMGFVREVASRVVFMDDGRVVEVGPAQDILDNPQTERAGEFMAKILRH